MAERGKYPYMSPPPLNCRWLVVLLFASVAAATDPSWPPKDGICTRGTNWYMVHFVGRISLTNPMLTDSRGNPRVDLIQSFFTNNQAKWYEALVVYETTTHPHVHFFVTIYTRSTDPKCIMEGLRNLLQSHLRLNKVAKTIYLSHLNGDPLSRVQYLCKGECAGKGPTVVYMQGEGWDLRRVQILHQVGGNLH